MDPVDHKLTFSEAETQRSVQVCMEQLKWQGLDNLTAYGHIMYREPVFTIQPDILLIAS